MKNFIYLFACILLFSCQENNTYENVPELTDGDPTTFFMGVDKINKLLFDVETENQPIRSYTLYSSGESPLYDPTEWTLKGSKDGKNWTVVDHQSVQSFCSRFQEKTFAIEKPDVYNKYMLEISSETDTVVIGDIYFHTTNVLSGWEDFKYPEIDFKDLNPETEGSSIYASLVQNPDEYIKYHAQKVAEILFYSARDTMNDVQKIHYTLKDYDGVSAKSGNPPAVAVVYSTRHIEKSAAESMYKLDYETRGVLYHELVHAYQFEPKGIGSYSTNREFWASIEGLADAVRADAGFFDIGARRKPGGHWLDGYQTTGFFIQWLKTKDPEAIRKFHLTVRDIDVWSFDKAIKAMFGEEHSIESMWNEYQEFLNS